MRAAKSKTMGILKRKAKEKKMPARKYFVEEKRRRAPRVAGIIMKISPLGIWPSVRGIEERTAKMKVAKIWANR